MLKVCVSDGASLMVMDLVEYQGRLWIVPAWIEWQRERLQAPARLIALDSVAHRQASANVPFQYEVSTIIPRAVLDGSDQNPEEAGFEVLERPGIAIPLQPRSQ